MSTLSLALAKENLRERTVERKGLVVIGGGITGLSAAISWACTVDARANPVVVLEKEPMVGGCVTSFRRKGYLFDTVQMAPDISDILPYLGVDIELRQIDGDLLRIVVADPARGTARATGIPSGWDAFRRMLRERFPPESSRVDRFISYTRAMFNELPRLKVEPGPLQLLSTPLRCPRVVANRNRTFREYINRFGFRDPELRDILERFEVFGALPAGRAAALMTAGALCSTMEGVYRTKRGFVDLPHQMRRRVVNLGGEVRTRAAVTRILVDEGRVWGVALADGSTIAADHVITTIDPTVAMRDLVGMDVLRDLDRRYAEKVASLRMSTSSLHVSLGLDDRIDLTRYGLQGGYTVLASGRDAFERLFQAADRDEIGQSESCFHLAVVCPSLITGGKPVLTIRAVPMPMADWLSLRVADPEAYLRKKEHWGDFCVGIVERYLIPGLREHILVRDVATPATFARYLGSPTGAIYDMAPYPGNFGHSRLRMRTPVRGLYQPKFSHGILPALLGGMQAVDMILGGKIMRGNVRFDRRGG